MIINITFLIMSFLVGWGGFSGAFNFFSLLDDERERERVFRIWAPHMQNLVAF
jgi:hypothetical protein